MARSRSRTRHRPASPDRRYRIDLGAGRPHEIPKDLFFILRHAHEGRLIQSETDHRLMRVHPRYVAQLNRETKLLAFAVADPEICPYRIKTSHDILMRWLLFQAPFDVWRTELDRQAGLIGDHPRTK